MADVRTGGQLKAGKMVSNLMEDNSQGETLFSASSNFKFEGK